MAFFDFWTESIAIDLGTANTLIIHNDKVVVDSPSIVAIDKKTDKIIAVGAEASCKQVCEVKSGIEKISFFDRTVRLFFFKAARFIWALRGKSVKSTILSEG